MSNEGKVFAFSQNLPGRFLPFKFRLCQTGLYISQYALSLTKFRLLRLLRRQQNKVNSNVWRLIFFTWFVYKYSKFGGHVKVLTREFFCDYTDVFVIIFCCVNLACYINFLYVPVAYRIKDIGEMWWSMKKYPQLKIWP